MRVVGFIYHALGRFLGKKCPNKMKLAAFVGGSSRLPPSDYSDRNFSADYMFDQFRISPANKL